MCGIAGILLRDSLAEEAEITLAVQSIAHRGPDGYGIQAIANGRGYLGHRRLSIIDLSETGAQPMCNEDQTIWITFNGEIYNYRQLREQLLKNGHTFKSQSDTEVLVHGYEEWGTGLLSKLEGMFAFAIWDEKKNELFIARDRFGIKPLYYYKNEGVFLFGSELKALYAFPQFKKEIDYTAVIDYLHYYVIPAHKSIWKNTAKLLPGQYLTVNAVGDAAVETYWKVQPGHEKVASSAAVERVNALLTKSIEQHLESDVPVGVFLSSGYDSSALVAYTKKFKDTVNTFSIGFKDSKKTEHVEAAALARHFDTKHAERVLDDDYMDVLEGLHAYYDEPFAVTSLVSYYYVSQLAQSQNKVVFAGDGGDEVFGGYKWYSRIDNTFRNRSLVSKLFRSDTESLKKFYQYQYFNQMGTDVAWVKSILSEDVMIHYPKDVYWAFDLPEDQWKLHPVKVFQLLDFKYFIPDVALPRADRSSMATSLEVRVPLLDHSLVEYMINLDTSVYYKPPVKKYLLFENIKEQVPVSILNLPKKGFGNPLNPFFAKRDLYIKRLKEGGLLKTNLFNKTLDIDSLDKKQLWLLYNLELWWSKWNK